MKIVGLGLWLAFFSAFLYLMGFFGWVDYHFVTLPYPGFVWRFGISAVCAVIILYLGLLEAALVSVLLEEGLW